MRIPTPSMEDKGDTAEEAGLTPPANPEASDVPEVVEYVNAETPTKSSEELSRTIGDVVIKREPGVTDTADDVQITQVVCARRKKRPREDTTQTTPVTTKVPRISLDTDANVRLALRMQKLAYQHHVMDMVKLGQTRDLKRFLEQKEGKIDVNFYDKDGETALTHSCMEGNIEQVKLLIRHGANPSLANRDGWNPVHIATCSGHHEIFRFLTGCR